MSTAPLFCLNISAADDLGVMPKNPRKAIVTDEHRQEAAKLKAIWLRAPRPEQGAFGETYEIGGQSAVSNFLRGDSPLSLKAARGFARGLGCEIADFSPRLAAEAAKNIEAAPELSKLSPETIEWALKYEKASPSERSKFRILLTVAVDAASPDPATWTRPDKKDGRAPEPMGPGDSGLGELTDPPPHKGKKR